MRPVWLTIRPSCQAEGREVSCQLVRPVNRILEVRCPWAPQISWPKRPRWSFQSTEDVGRQERHDGSFLARSSAWASPAKHRRGGWFSIAPGRGYDHRCRRRTEMPLFMDRHDVPGVTAEQVAQAHLADLDAGPKFGVQFLAYWFDADQDEAFCLAKAPTGDSLTAVHKATHGLIPNEIISVSEDNVLRLLGRMSETGTDAPGVNPFRT